MLIVLVVVSTASSLDFVRMPSIPEVPVLLFEYHDAHFRSLYITEILPPFCGQGSCREPGRASHDVFVTSLRYVWPMFERFEAASF